MAETEMTEVLVRLEAHEHEIKSLKHRVDEVEDATKAIQQLTISVEKMAMTMQSMVQAQQKLGDRLERLEAVPAEKAKFISNQTISVIIAGGVGAILTKLLSLLL